MNLDTYAKRLNWAMSNAAISQSELARAIGVKQQAIQYLCQKGTKSTHTTKIAKALGVSADWLDTGKGSPEPKQDNNIYSYKISVNTGKSSVVVLSKNAEDVIKKINRYIENGWDVLGIDRIQPSCTDADQPGTTTKYAY